MPNNRTWRDRARPIIAKVIAENQGKPEKELRAALREAYPWGERRLWPYKVWCSEIRAQLGIDTKGKAKHEDMIAAGQLGFFQEERVED